MNLDDFAPATQVRGWLRSLCEQNLENLTQTMRERRINRSRVVGYERIMRPLDESVTDEDRANAGNYYHRAFWEIVHDQIMLGEVNAMLFEWESLIPAEPWMFEAKFRRGHDWVGVTCDHVFANLNETYLSVTMPEDPNKGGRGIPELDRQRREENKRRGRLVRFELLWPKHQLPSLAELNSYARLPEGREPNPPIPGLQGLLTPEGRAILKKINEMGFKEKNRAIAIVFAHKYPTGIAEGMPVKEFARLLRGEHPDLERMNYHALRKAIGTVRKKLGLK